MANGQQQMSPQQQNAMIRQLILRGGPLGNVYFPPAVDMWQQLNPILPSSVGPGSVITVQLRNVGLVKRLIFEFSATITAGATTAQTLTPLGLANLITGRGHGAQLGLANVIISEFRGGQVGLVNVAGYDATGLQAGLVNVTARRQHGLMLGLINVAPQADVSIGLLNVHTHGKTKLDVWATDAGIFMLGVKHGTGISHNLYGIGWKPMGDTPAFAAAFGIGFSALRAQPISLDVDLVAYGLMARDPNQNRFNFAGIYQLRIPITLGIVRGVAVFVAPSVSVSMADTDSHLQDLALYKTTRLTSSQGAAWVVRIWPGASIGLRFF